MIQEYLNEQLIPTSDDTSFDKIKRAANELSKKITKDTDRILELTLVAFDPSIPADNNQILEIRKSIIDNWPTFLPSTKDTALTIIRAVILEALSSISENKTHASLIWFTARNSIKHFKLLKEKKILSDFLTKLSNKIENEVSEKWDFSPDSEIEIPKIVPAAIDSAELATNINNIPALGEQINKAFKKQVSELKESQKKFIQLNSLMQMRTQLLWWKEAAYSRSQNSSFKDFKDGALQLILAKDYSALIPEMYPVSVDYFLLETHKSLSPASEKKIKISDFLKMIEDQASTLKETIEEYEGDSNRLLFANFLQGLIHGKYEAKKFKNLVGIPENTETTLSELTLWLFHDLHAIKISTSN